MFRSLRIQFQELPEIYRQRHQNEGFYFEVNMFLETEENVPKGRPRRAILNNTDVLVWSFV